ncbi:DUF559 domain-containing protein [Agromyces archimandritae]|uniref:DUF559 domain-containing protein n=1 Tax=Agromyces archimandritae TaxID=2781962 RepID=A0A975FKB8_9MICO|nr:DUF559 domain-containing protein [Agromyces archimandritae]QTX03507.1 DUF559 domain-containing protein [Agromyces archimandritae]
MPGPRIPLPVELAGRPFSVAVATAAGIGAGRLRGADLVRPFHGVRMPASTPRELGELCRAKLVTMRPGDVFSHVTACRLYGIPVPRRWNDREPIDVAAFVPAGIPRGAGVRGHRLSPGRVLVTGRSGLPLVSPEDAWAQLAASVGERDLVIAADALVRRKHPLATPERVADAVDRHAGGRGCRLLAAALEAMRPGTDSAPESEVRLDLVAYGLPEPEVNGEIRDSNGRLVAIGDLVYRAQRTLVEYDGDQHRTSPAQYARDVDRLDDLARLGWRVIRINRSHTGTRRIERLERVREALLAAGWRPSDA